MSGGSSSAANSALTLMTVLLGEIAVKLLPLVSTVSSSCFTTVVLAVLALLATFSVSAAVRRLTAALRPRFAVGRAAVASCFSGVGGSGDAARFFFVGWAAAASCFSGVGGSGDAARFLFGVAAWRPPV